LIDCLDVLQENVREVFETATRAALNTKTKKKGGCSVL
jgi:hypothetical protein